ncbi:MAG TPA: LCP family protein [Symbiobacteriaceae bacterium]|jgi:LCP family protein required for cell wall assembly
MDRRKRRTEWRFLAGFLAGLLLAAGSLFAYWNLVPKRPLWSSPAQPAAQSPAAAPAPVNVLVLGVDERKNDVGRSDTMLLVRFEAGGVRVISIPRDTLVTIDGHGDSKANAAFAYGGAGLSRKVVSDLLGLPVDYYVKVNMEGFKHLVDLMGGVPFNVPKPMYYVDPDDDLVIDLKPGPQLLDGKKAEEFVRFRHDENGDDMGRVARQQAFMKAAAARALTPANLPKLPALLFTASRYLQTNIPVTEQWRLVQALYQAAQSPGALVEETLPGRGDYAGDVSYFVVNRAELTRLKADWQ